MISTTRKLLEKIRGAYALGIMCSEHPDTLIAVRQGSPLLIGLGKGENYIASDIPALLEYTREYYLLDEQEIAVLKKDDVKLFAAIGLVLGGHGTLAVLVLSSLLSAAVFSVQLIRKKIKRTDSLPLGPYICGSAIFYVAFISPLL
jgi:prepilin signal peptidase PulO-like enzyme (type II secretory pathway)